jgi:hypothetical protein
VPPVTTVRCPKCGTINPDGGRRLARCRSCHEALGKCRYCRYYDPRQLDCTHLARRTDERILDADEVLNCPDFETTLAGRPPSRLVPILRTTLLSAALGLGFMLGLIRLVGPRKAPPPAFLRTSVTAPATVFQEEGLEIKMFVRNEAEQPASDIRVYISGRSMRQLICQSVEPAEAFEEATPQYACAWLGELGPGEIGTVSFRFSANVTGKLDLAARVTAANVSTPDTTPIECEIVP